MSGASDHIGRIYQGNIVSDQGVAHFGDNVTHIQTQINNSIGLTINSKAAGRTDYNGQYSHVSLLPVKNYVPRPKLHQKIVTQLHDSLRDGDGERRLLIVYGIGGAGKSQLVRNYIREYRLDYTAVFWIEAGRRETLERDFIQIFGCLFDERLLNREENNIKVEDAVSAVKNYFQRSDKKWLMVFDSADAIDDNGTESYIDLDFFLPDDPSVHIVVTTRSATAKDMSDLEAVEVAEMERAEAIELFLKYAKMKDALVETTTEIEVIVEELGYLALAITLAGSYVAATPRLRSDITKYLPEFRQRRIELLRQKPRRLIHRYGESVLTTWETTFSALTCQSPVASKFLTLLAFLHFDDIFMELFGPTTTAEGSASQASEMRCDKMWMSLISSQDSVSLHTVEAAFQTLESYALAQWKPDQRSYSIHKLVHVWAYERLDEDHKYIYNIAALELLTDAINQCGPKVADKNRLVPHLMTNFGILSASYKTKNIDDDTTTQIKIFSAFLDSLGRWTDVCATESFFVEHYTKLHGDEHPDTISAMNNLAVTFRHLGHLDQAVKLQKDVSAKRKRILGEEHPDTISAMNNLANTLGDLGQLHEAVEIYEEVLKKRRLILGEEHPNTISAMNNLAITLRALGQVDEAIKINKEVFEKMRRILGEEHPATVSAMNNLAITLGALGHLDEAAEIEKKVFQTRRRILGDEHPDTARAVYALVDFNNKLAAIRINRAEFDEAQKILQTELETSKKFLGTENASTLDTVRSLAQIYKKKSDLGGMVKLTREWGLEVVKLYGDLGRLFLQFPDELNAQIAFQSQAILLDGVEMHAKIMCDGCALRIPHAMSRFVCKNCEDGDLCGACFEKREDGGLEISTCIDHSFLEVSMPNLSPNMAMTDAERQLWFEHLQRKYVDCG